MRVDKYHMSDRARELAPQDWITIALQASKQDYGIISEPVGDPALYIPSTQYVAQAVDTASSEFNLNTYNTELQALVSADRYIVTDDIGHFESLVLDTGIVPRQRRGEMLEKMKLAENRFRLAKNNGLTNALIGFTFKLNPGGQNPWDIVPFIHPGRLDDMSDGFERFRDAFSGIQRGGHMRFGGRVHASSTRV